MGKLEESGMSIGDFAMSLMDSGQVSKKGSTPEVARPKELPISEVDISEVRVSTSMVNKVLNESFGLSLAEEANNAHIKQSDSKPIITEQELLQEKIVSLKEELVETINKLSSLVSEMTGMTGLVGGVSTTQSFGPGPSNPHRGNRSGRNKRSKVIKRTSN